MPKMFGYQYLANAFLNAGIEHIFLMPTHLYTTLVELEGTPIKRILVHNEKAGVYMADGYAKASGKPAVIITQGGPGATNAVSGLAEPWQSNTPVILMTQERPAGNAQTDSYQEIIAQYDRVTKYNGIVNSLSRLPDMLNQAFRVATTGAPGPVRLGFKVNAGLSGLETEEGDLPEPWIDPRYTRYPAFRPEPEPEAVQAAARMLAAAKRPVIVAGGGVIVSGAWDEVVEMAEILSVPVATTLSGKGTIPENHPLALGVTGTYSRKCATDSVAQADLVVFIGAHTGSQSTNSWTSPRVGTPVIQIDINGAQIGKNYPIAVGVEGDAKVTVRRMIEALRAIPNKEPKTEWVEETRGKVKAFWDDFADRYHSDSTPITDERVCKELTEFLPKDALVVCDTGFSGCYSGSLWELRTAGKNYIRCEGSLGWGFPAAIGAKLAVPNRPVLCFTGDGGLQYHLTELETALRWGVKTVTLVRNNHALVQDTRLLDNRYGKKAYDIAEYTELNYAKIAEAYGAVGIRVEHPSEIRPALEKAFAADRAVIIDMVVDHEGWYPNGGRSRH